MLYSNGQTRIGGFFRLVSRTGVERIAPVVKWRYIGKVVGLGHMPGVFATFIGITCALSDIGVKPPLQEMQIIRKPNAGILLADCLGNRDNCRECPIASQHEVAPVTI